MAEDLIYPVTKSKSNGVGLDIMVPTHGRLELTVPCIDRLYSYTQTPFHLIVCDSDPEGEEGLTQHYFEKLMRNKGNITFIHKDRFKNGNEFFNIALKHTQTDYFATVMNSTWVEPDWEIVALDIMKRQLDVGTIGLKALFPPGHLHHDRIECAGIAMNGYTPIDIGRDESGHRLNGTYEVVATQWAFALHRKLALVGNLDENTYHGHVGWDDIDNCFVIRKKGWKILYCGMGTAYHHARATRGNDSEEAQKKNLENARTFYKRWGFWDMYCKANKLNQVRRGRKKRK